MADTNLPPGPKLDALVAEAMGWTRTGHPIMPWAMPSGDLRQRPIPYSTTGNGMLAMLEWMRAKGWFINLNYWPDGATTRVYVAGTSILLARTSENAAPHAVALALLEAAVEAAKAEKEKTA